MPLPFCNEIKSDRCTHVHSNRTRNVKMTVWMCQAKRRIVPNWPCFFRFCVNVVTNSISSSYNFPNCSGVQTWHIIHMQSNVVKYVDCDFPYYIKLFSQFQIVGKDSILLPSWWGIDVESLLSTCRPRPLTQSCPRSAVEFWKQRQPQRLQRRAFGTKRTFGMCEWWLSLP